MANNSFPPDSSHSLLPQGVPELGSLSTWGTIRHSRGAGWDKMRIYGEYAFVYLLEGNGIYRDPGGEVKVSAGCLITVFPEIPHCYGSLERNWSEIYLCFTGALFNAYRAAKWLNPDYPVNWLEPVPFWFHRFLEVVKPEGSFGRTTPSEYLGRLQLLICEMANYRFQSLHPDPDWLVRAKTLLQDCALSDLKSVAKGCGLSYENFRKKFTSLVGQSPHQFRQANRIAQAKSMLAYGGYSSKETARILRFTDEYHFSKSIKAATGFSPSKFKLKT